MPDVATDHFLTRVRDRLTPFATAGSGDDEPLFASVTLDAGAGRVACRPVEVDAASYEAAIHHDANGRSVVTVGLYLDDRWISESIEADLMHTGDDMEELVEDELVELGHEERFAIEHYRDEDHRFVFRSVLDPAGRDADEAGLAELAATLLLAYRHAFVELGDMDGGGEDED